MDKQIHKKLLRGGSGVLAAAVLLGSFPGLAYGAVEEEMEITVAEEGNETEDSPASEEDRIEEPENQGQEEETETGTESEEEMVPAHEEQEPEEEDTEQEDDSELEEDSEDAGPEDVQLEGTEEEYEKASPSEVELMVMAEELPDGAVAVSRENFPDNNFRAWILEQPMGKDKILTRKELEETTYIYLNHRQIRDLTGIEYFENLVGLVCEYNYLETVNLESNTKLELLDISNNNLTSIDVSGLADLKQLDVLDNKLTELDLSGNGKLDMISAGDNDLTELDLSGNHQLQGMAVYYNKLETIILPDSGIKVDLSLIEEQDVPEEGYRQKVKWMMPDGEVIEDDFEAQNQTITSRLDPIQYRVNYYEDERSYTPWLESQYTYEDSVKIAEMPPERPGYEFTGWKVKGGKLYEAGEEPGEPLTLTDGKTVSLYGQWTGNPYTIVFHSNPPADEENGDTTVRQEMVYGKSARLKANTFAVTGAETYEFVGWSLESGDDREVAYYNRMEVSDLTAQKNGEVHLYAQWRVAPKYYDVTFQEMEEGTYKTSSNQSVLEDGKAKEAFVGFRKGYRFDGWYTSPELEEAAKYDFNTAVTQPITLYGNWYTETYQVEFLSEGQIIHTGEVQMDYSVTLPAAPERAGYRFAGWYETEDYQGYPYDVGRMVGGDFKLYAKWIPLNQYYVYFETNQGTEVEGQMVEEGSKVQIPEEPQREGYRFTGWYADPQLRIPFNFQEPVHYNRVVYAGWEEWKEEEVLPPEGEPETDEGDSKPFEPSEPSKPSGGSGGSGGGGGKASGAGQPGLMQPVPTVYFQAIQGNWIQAEKGWQFAALDSGNVKNAWAMIENTWYLFDSYGYMKTGWYEDPQGQWYYLKPDGGMATGWQTVNGVRYYFQTNGSMAKGTENSI